MKGALIASVALSAFSAVQQGRAAKNAASSQAEAYRQEGIQAQRDARTATIERKRALIETMASQNVTAATQGRTISSISALQKEDVRRAKLDKTLIEGGASAKTASAYRAGEAAKEAGKSAVKSSYLNAGSTIAGGYYTYKKNK